MICCCGKELAGNKVAVHHTALQGLCHKCGDTSANMTTLGVRNSSAHMPHCALRKAVKYLENELTDLIFATSPFAFNFLFKNLHVHAYHSSFG